MEILLVTLLTVVFSRFAHGTVRTDATPWKGDSRFSTSCDYINLLQYCASASSIKHRELRRLQVCNPHMTGLGFPGSLRNTVYKYRLVVMGKKGFQFTMKKEQTPNNVYYENYEESFVVHPGMCKYYIFSNLGDGVNDSRIIYSIQDQSREQCSEKSIRKRQSKGRFSQEYESLTFMSGENETTKIIRSIFFTNQNNQLPSLDDIINTFWPASKTSAWKQVSESMQKHTNHVDLHRIERNIYKDRLMDLQNIISIGHFNIEHFVMLMSDEFLDQEDSDPVKDDAVLQADLLPIFSITASLFITFHHWAIKNAGVLKFQPYTIALLKKRRDSLVEYSHNYIMKVYDENMELAYNSCDLSEYFYNCMVDVHNRIALGGIQYLPVWRTVSEFKSNDLRTYDVLLYSRSFGTPTMELMKSAIFRPKEEFPAVTPPISSSLKNCIKHNKDDCFMRQNITRIYVKYCHDKRKISKVTASFNNTITEVVGERDDLFSLFENEIITKIVVGGNGAIDYIKFYLSNGFVPTFGYLENINHLPSTTYEMKGYYIASIAANNDNVQKLNDQALNIAVSYRALTSNLYKD